MKPKITVIGSTNTDFVIKTDRFPVPGETIVGEKLLTFQGGKGCNQAVAACRLGANVFFVSKVGNDVFGYQCIENLRKEGIEVSNVTVDENNSTGVALITVSSTGENSIVAAKGANDSLSEEDINRAIPSITESKIILMQLEIPVESVLFAASISKEKNKKIILNPAPATKIPDTLYNLVDIITPNRSEAHFFSGIEVNDVSSAKQAALFFYQRGVKEVIITLGNEGAYYYSSSHSALIPAPKVTAIDTTGAGDVFNGALSLALAKDLEVLEAIRFANKAASIAVTKMGAFTSAPYEEEILSF